MSDNWATPLNDILKAMEMVSIEHIYCTYCGFTNAVSSIATTGDRCFNCGNKFENVRRITEEE